MLEKYDMSFFPHAMYWHVGHVGLTSKMYYKLL